MVDGRTMSKMRVMSLSMTPEMVVKVDSIVQSLGYETRSSMTQDMYDHFMTLDKDTWDSLKNASLERGVAVSEIIKYLVDCCPLDDFPSSDKDVRTIPLKIKVSEMRDATSLRAWLKEKVDALILHLFPQR